MFSIIAQFAVTYLLLSTASIQVTEQDKTLTNQVVIGYNLPFLCLDVLMTCCCVLSRSEMDASMRKPTCWNKLKMYESSRWVFALVINFLMLIAFYFIEDKYESKPNEEFVMIPFIGFIILTFAFAKFYFRVYCCKADIEKEPLPFEPMV
jgi:hypothetical protein